ncbi:uncharacterized membrane protein YraQ (UPF0718 family) [Weissella uvarum]|nr:uncharacterized membrane protein YraQ (UPF0718 family) [Weissella uvarum]
MTLMYFVLSVVISVVAGVIVEIIKRYFMK